MRAGGGRGETLVPLAGAGVTVARLQEGALQFADVGLVLAQLRGRVSVLDRQTTNTQEEVRGGARGGRAGHGEGRRVRGGEAGGDHHRNGPCVRSREGAGAGIGSSRRGVLMMGRLLSMVVTSLGLLVRAVRTNNSTFRQRTICAPMLGNKAFRTFVVQWKTKIK